MEKEKENNINGTESLGDAMSYDFTADEHLFRNEYDKAIECYHKALAVTENVLGKDHPSTYIEYSHLGDVYMNMGNYEKALEHYQKALAHKMKDPDKDKYPHVTASLYSDIGNAYSELGENDKALESFKQSMLIREKVFPSDHPMVATSYNEIAWTYCLLKQYAEALPWAEKCVASCPLVPYFIDTLATTYQGLGRLEEAMEQFEQCLKLKKEQGRMGGHTEESIQQTETKIAQLKELMKG